MAKSDVDESQPRQQHGGEQEYGGDDLGGTRSRGGRFDRFRLRGRGIENGMRALRVRRGARTALVDRAVRMVLDADIRRSAGITGARAGKRDERGDDGAEKRQKDDRVTRSPRKAEKATRLRLTASRITSIDIRMMITFLRLRKMPKMPIVNRIAATVR
jgi:hypothetical protein